MQIFFSTPERQQRLRAGPLSDDIDGFAAWLASEGFDPNTGRQKLRLVSDLSRWLDDSGLAVDALRRHTPHCSRLRPAGAKDWNDLLRRSSPR